MGDVLGMKFRTVKDVLDALPNAEWRGPNDAQWTLVNGFSTDSRSINEGEVFIALKGESFDGHDYVAKVAEKASVAVVSKQWAASQQETDLPLIAVDDPLAAYGAIAREHRRSLTIPIIAIAGSNGKTTTKELVATVLGARFEVLKTTGNLNNLIGVPATMLKIGPQHTAAVVEIGTNSPGEIEQLCAILEPTHGVITNIGREHLELLGSIEGVAEEEGALFRYLDRTGGTAFVNADDEQLRRVSNDLKQKRTYALHQSADVTAEVERLSEEGTPILRMQSGEEKAIVTLRLPGMHSATNALAATTIGLSFGLTLEEIRLELESFEPLQASGGYARLAPVRATNGALILNDTYNANPDSMLVAFHTLRAMPLPEGGRRIVVLGDMRELGASSPHEHTHLGEEVARDGAIDVAFFFGDEMRRAQSAASRDGVDSRSFDDKAKLIETLREVIQPNDLVLVKGSRGMKMEEVVVALCRG